MRKIGPALALVVTMGLPSAAHSVPLTYTATFVVTPTAGPDTAGLSGATLTFSALFGTTLYGPIPPFASAAIVTSHTLTITGSAGSDGVYSDPLGVFWDPGGPTFVNSIFFFPSFGPLAGGQVFSYGIFLTLGPPIPPVGAPVTTADFGPLAPFSFLTTTPDGTTYGIAPVPPPIVGPVGGPTPVELLSFEIE